MGLLRHGGDEHKVISPPEQLTDPQQNTPFSIVDLITLWYAYGWVVGQYVIASSHVTTPAAFILHFSSMPQSPLLVEHLSTTNNDCL